MKKIYKGTIKEIKLIETSALGIQTYKLGFATGSALFQISSKRRVPVKVGDLSLFTGTFLSEKVFLIDDINCASGYSIEQKYAIMSEQSYRQMMIRQ
jgi:hypothetical protein